MQFKLASVFTLLAAASAALAQGPIIQDYPVTYDQTYDNPSDSLAIVACSNGKNGLLTKGFTNFSSIPSFPYIGGSVFVTGWNSTECGSCWKMTYEGTTIFLTAIDTAGVGFNIAEEAMKKLGGEAAIGAGKINVTVEAATPQDCGFSA